MIATNLLLSRLFCTGHICSLACLLVTTSSKASSMRRIGSLPSTTHTTPTWSLSSKAQFHVVTRTNHSITIESTPSDGTDSATHATFRLITKGGLNVSREDLIGQVMKLKMLYLLGMVVVHNGPVQDLLISNKENGVRFRIIGGLDGRNDDLKFRSIVLVAVQQILLWHIVCHHHSEEIQQLQLHHLSNQISPADIQAPFRNQAKMWHGS